MNTITETGENNLDRMQSPDQLLAAMGEFIDGLESNASGLHDTDHVTALIDSIGAQVFTLDQLKRDELLTTYGGFQSLLCTQNEDLSASSEPFGFMKRRNFLKLGGGSLVSAILGWDHKSPKGNRSAFSESGEEPHEGELHSARISQRDLLASIGVTTVFAGIVGAPLLKATAEAVLPKGLKQTEVYNNFSRLTDINMSPKTSLSMFAAWCAKMEALRRDFNNPDPEEAAASKAAYEHEKAELKNVPIALGLAAASEVTSYFNLKDIEFAEQIEEPLIEEIFDGQDKFTLPDGTQLDVKRFIKSLSPDSKVYQAMRAYAEAGGASPAEFIEQGMADIFEQQFGLLDEKESAAAAAKFENYFRNEFGQDFETALQDEFHTYLDKVDTTHIIHYLLQYRDRHPENNGNGINNLIAGLEKSITKKTSLMLGMGMSLAPLSLTFTTASLANKQIPDIATDLLALNLAKSIQQAENWNDFDPYTVFDYIKNKTLNNDVNGSAGIVNLAVAALANYNGAAFAGDPPNIFYWLNYGLKQWAHASIEGLKRSTIISELSLNAYLMKIGINPLKTAGQQLLGQLQGLAIPGKTLERLPFFRAGFKKLGGMIDKAGLTSDQRNALGFNWDEIRTVSIDKEGLTSNLSERAQEFFYVEDLRELKDTLKNFFRGKKEKPIIPDDISDEVKAAAEAELKNLEYLIREQTTAGGRHLSVDEIVEIINSEEEFANLRFVDQEELNKYINQLTSDRDQHKHREHYMSHAALDVRNALLTQLWVVGSIQTVVKKAMGLDKDMPLSLAEIKQKTRIIMGSIIGMSAVADNVAAMLFGINVLEGIADKLIAQIDISQLNEEAKSEFEADAQDIKDTIRANAMLLAIFAGNLSFIGNGANMSIQLVHDIVVKLFDKLSDMEGISDRELFEMINLVTEETIESEPVYVEATRQANNLPRSITNVPAIASNIYNFVLSQRQIMKKYDQFNKRYAA